HVVNLDKLTYAGNPENLAPLAGNDAYVFVQGDIADRPLVARLLAEHRPAAVINFAAESHVDRSIDSPGEFVRTNVLGTFELLEQLRPLPVPREADPADDPERPRGEGAPGLRRRAQRARLAARRGSLPRDRDGARARRAGVDVQHRRAERDREHRSRASPLR